MLQDDQEHLTLLDVHQFPPLSSKTYRMFASLTKLKLHIIHFSEVTDVIIDEVVSTLPLPRDTGDGSIRSYRRVGAYAAQCIPCAPPQPRSTIEGNDSEAGWSRRVCRRIGGSSMDHVGELYDDLLLQILLLCSW
ncbi:hypothetical protein GUJ93_ZPchr0008g13718 [Zizania palustris]|uniref:Uncharacterized protein n=1 Tax=Zizania palustris TaxID=103762 RepID=A0A8J5RJ21_ZIZPA|nr:hypothetical protein GUJ93_ZPchr0008g13718 [Zizania palustris]